MFNCIGYCDLFSESKKKIPKICFVEFANINNR